MNELSCRTDTRRDHLRKHPAWNGLDFVEVDEAQTLLTVSFLGHAPEHLHPRNFQIDGGRTERDRVKVETIEVLHAQQDFLDDQVLLHVDKPGDSSTYTLRLVGVDRIDPRYSSVDFSFKANCPTGLDCAPACAPEPAVSDATAIDYLVKDYAGFRQLILDRLALICPDWKERHVPDLGIALVEVLAYAADYLSYYQDAVATEAYLDTARRRPSVRRHARLVDYALLEGCNARALVAIETATDLRLKAKEVWFSTAVNRLLQVGDRAALVARELDPLPKDAYEVFRPMGPAEEIPLWQAHNALRLYTWGGRECCLHQGATRATLMDVLVEDGGEQHQGEQYQGKGKGKHEEPAEPASAVHLKPGSFLIFEEVMGPVTGAPGDADPSHRQAVRLTSVRHGRDELLHTPIVEIEWAEEDALRFDLCISAVGAAPKCRYLEDVTVARGNVVPADHGRPVGPEELGIVPSRRSPRRCECEGHPSETTTLSGRYRPRLASAPLTHVAPYGAGEPAAALFAPSARDAVPAIRLSSEDGTWEPRGDLLQSGEEDRHFVVELEEDGTASLRFGDGDLGKRPPPAQATFEADHRVAQGAQQEGQEAEPPEPPKPTFKAHYRVGNGPAGNVGAGSISVLVHEESNLTNDITRVWNPLPAQGGTAPEPMAEAKLNAPQAFRFGPAALRRAITPADYAQIAGRQRKIQRAAARLVWTGSWFEAAVGVDVKAAFQADLAAVDAGLRRYLEPFRRMGQDLSVRPAEEVPIDLGLEVCILPEYLKGHVKAALLDAFSNRALPGGRLGFFHPDRLTFGTDLYLSEIVAAAQAVPGVASVKVTRLQRQFEASNQEIENGVLELGPFRVARLDNSPAFPDRGRLQIQILGGRG